VILSIVIVGLHAAPSRAQVASMGDISTRCKALASTDFSQILDAPTQVIETKLVAASFGPVEP